MGFVSRFLYDPSAGIFMYHLLPQLSQRKYQTFAFVVGLSNSMKTQQTVAQIAERVTSFNSFRCGAYQVIAVHSPD